MERVKINKHKRKEYLGNAAVAILPFVGWIIFSAVPLIISLVMVLFRFQEPTFEGATFVGFDNIRRIFSDYGLKFGYSLLNTLIYSLKLPIGIVISLWISVMLNKVKNKIARNVLRGIFFVTYVCSISVIIISFRMLIDEGTIGVFNHILGTFGYEAFRWMTSSPWSFHLSAMMIGVWSSIGYNVVMFQAAMSGIDESYYEAARIDGASEMRCFWKIIGCFQAYAETQVLASGASGIPLWENSQETGPWLTSAMWIYTMMFNDSMEFGFGMASATGWILAIIIFIVIRINLRLQKKWVCYDF